MNLTFTSKAKEVTLGISSRSQTAGLGMISKDKAYVLDMLNRHSGNHYELFIPLNADSFKDANGDYLLVLE